MEKPIGPSVNYHLIKACNMRCKFCFATFLDLPNAKIDLDASKRIIDAIAEAGFEKLTLAGGEPTLIKELPELIRHGKEAGLVTTIVTNGSRLAEQNFLEAVAEHLDWMALSIDSVDEQVNRASGRSIRGTTVLSEDFYLDLTQRVKQLGVRLKVNTVVSHYNRNDDMVPFINQALPERWKILQALEVGGQNHRQQGFVVSRAEYERYIARSRQANPQVTIVAENTELIRGSYLMVSPEGSFFDSAAGKHTYSEPILEVGVQQALKQVHFDRSKFLQRGGVYAWRSLIVNS